MGIVTNGPLRRSTVLQYLAVQIPVCIMLILTLYTLRDLRPTSWPAVLPTALAAATGLRLKTRNAVISVLGATALHVVLSTLWQA
ncbi:AzlD domain-containing protein [Nonomuraea sp. NPDC059194]|uniref:AzlD domain-containing protein n=1 Tax=Nonomuraea sp. NPDC059194 TaxID=3346764 RepID=UPI0036D10D36